MKPKTIIKLVHLVCCFVYQLHLGERLRAYAIIDQIRDLKDE